MKRLEGRVAIVTGASQGIGNAIARAFVREGAAVVINARREDAIRKVAEELSAGGGRVFLRDEIHYFPKIVPRPRRCSSSSGSTTRRSSAPSTTS